MKQRLSFHVGYSLSTEGDRQKIATKVDNGITVWYEDN